MKATWWFWYVCSLSLKDRKNFRRCSMEWEARCYGSWMKSVPLMNSLCLSLLGEQLRVFRGEDGPHEVRAGSNIGILIPPRGTRARIFRPQSATVPKLRSALTKNSFLLLLCLFYFFLTHFLLFFFLPNKSVVQICKHSMLILCWQFGNSTAMRWFFFGIWQTLHFPALLLTVRFLFSFLFFIFLSNALSIFFFHS